MITDTGIIPPRGGRFDAADCSNFVEVLRWRATHQPDDVAFRFLHNGVEESCVMTYGHLDRCVKRLASRLQQQQLSGERVLLLLPSGPDYVIAILACLYAGAVGVPLYPPLPNRHYSRLEAVCRDAQPRAALATQRVIDRTGEQLAQIAEQFGFRVLATDGESESQFAAWQPPLLDRDSVGYIQYTSGSTLDAKGVMVTHGNLLHNCGVIAQVVGHSADHVGVNWLPFFHDMGLVGNVFVPLFVGFPVVCMPPESFVMKPISWLSAISHYGGTIAAAPNFAFNLCVQRTTASQRADLDLSRWQVAFNGAERIDGRTLERFGREFESTGFAVEAFTPCYGLAESTLFVTGGYPARQPVVRHFDAKSLGAGIGRPVEKGVPLVSCGDTHDESDLMIVDPQSGRRCPEEHIGEIWVAGPSVTAGYWNRPDLTSARFVMHDDGNGTRRYLRTGDLGLLFTGELYVTGRLKDLVIIGGQNIYPDDVEAAVEAAHHAVCHGGAFAFAVEDESGAERLVIAVEIDQREIAGGDFSQLARKIRDSVAQQIDVAVNELAMVKRNSLPRTTNGKKQRAACREEFVQRRLKRLVDS